MIPEENSLARPTLVINFPVPVLGSGTCIHRSRRERERTTRKGKERFPWARTTSVKFTLA